VKKLLIKNVTGTSGGASGRLEVDCSDGGSYLVPRDVPRSTYRNATIAVLLDENGETVTIAKVEEFGENGRPTKWIPLVRGNRLTLDGTEEVIDCRQTA